MQVADPGHSIVWCKGIPAGRGDKNIYLHAYRERADLDESMFAGSSMRAA